MTVTGQSPWRQLGDLTADQFKRGIPSNSPLLPEIAAIYAAVTGYSAVYKAHLEHENSFATTGEALNTADHNAQGSKDHTNGGYMQFASWTAGAAWWKQHVTDPNGYYKDAATIADYIHIYAPASDGNDEALYVSIVCKYGNQVLAPATTPPASPPPPAASGGPTMSTTTIPGLPGGPLTTSFPIDTETYMIPASNTYQRPGIKANTPRRSVQHGTGNPNSLAADDASWVHGGADGIQESMHFEIDDTQCFQLVPVDEVTWQAADGAGPGNYNGVSAEMTENSAVWGDPTRRAKAIANAAELLGKLAARFSIAIPEQHYTFNFADPNRHDCPNRLRHTLLEDGTLAWDRYVTLWNAAKTAELAAMSGTPVPVPAPTPTYASPAAPEWWGALVKQGWYNDRGTFWYRTNAQYTVAKATPRSRYADPNGTVRVGPDLAVGDVVNAAAVGTSQSGGQWIISTYLTRVNLADLAYVDPAAAA